MLASLSIAWSPMNTLNGKAEFIDEIEAGVMAIFTAYAQNSSVPPATVFRLEGFIEAACILGILTEQEAKKMIQSAWKIVFADPFPDSATTSIMIPAMMQRAPVYPSTKV